MKKPFIYTSVIFLSIYFSISFFAAKSQGDSDPNVINLLDKLKGIKSLQLTSRNTLYDNKGVITDEFNSTFYSNGTSYRIDTDNIIIISTSEYNGTYNKTRKEITIDEPLTKSSVLTNPMYLLSSLGTTLRVTYKGERNVSNRLYDEFDVFPTQGNNEFSIIRLSLLNNVLKTVVYHLKNGTRLEIDILSIKENATIPSNNFLLETSTFPSATINDLR